MEMNPKKGNLKAGKEFGCKKGYKLPNAEKVSKPETEFTGSQGKGGMPKGA